MSGIKKPFIRCCRPFTDGSYANGGKREYIHLPNYANGGKHYLNAFMLFQEDLRNLFNYVAPGEANKTCYSYRILELLTRSCIEIEANFRAILLENNYAQEFTEKEREKRTNDTGNIKLYWRDYVKIEKSHRLSEYKIEIPLWQGESKIRSPFLNWENEPPKWWKAYTGVKHDRYERFTETTFNQLMDAASALAIIICSQFHTENFSGIQTLIAQPSRTKVVGDCGFEITFPEWPPTERYGFTYENIKRMEQEEHPCQAFFKIPSR